MMNQTKSIVDVAARGSTMTKTYDEDYELMKKLFSNYHQMIYDRIVRKPTPRLVQIDAFDTIYTQILALSQKVQILKIQSQANAQLAQVISYEFCDTAHSREQCPMQAKLVNYIGNFNTSQNNPYSNTYIGNLGWRNHLNFEDGGNQSGGQKLQTQPQAQS